MWMKATLPIVLAAVALAAAGCGGSASTSAGTGSVAGTVATLPATTTSASASFRVQVGAVQRRLHRGLQGLEKGNLADAAMLLTTCQNGVTRQLGSRASTASQQQSVADLRTACDDIAKAEAKLRHGDVTVARSLAKDALGQVAQAAG